MKVAPPPYQDWPESLKKLSMAELGHLLTKHLFIVKFAENSRDKKRATKKVRDIENEIASRGPY
jgi:hypothetical protein